MLETFEIDIAEVAGCPEPVKKLISLEKETPVGLLEACYAALVGMITVQGFPTIPPNETERSMLLHCVLKVSFTPAAKVLQKHVETPAKPFESFQMPLV